VRLARNTIPPPPQVIYGQQSGLDAFLRWIERTFAAGTRVRFKAEHGGTVQDMFGEWVTLPPGTVGVVRSVDTRYGMNALTVDATVSTPLFTSASVHHVRAVVGYGEAAKNLEPLDDNWGPLVVRSKPKYRLPTPRKTTSRRVRPNAVPPAPDPQDDASWRQWWYTTFPKGSAAKMLVGASFQHESGPPWRSKIWDYDCSNTTDCSVYLSGVVTIGDEGPNGTEIYFVVPYGPDAGRWSRWVGWRHVVGREQIVRMLKPLDDHWAPLQPTKRYHVPTPRKTTSRRLRSNTIPPPPVGGNDKDRERWQSITYAAGTPVRLKHTVEFHKDLRSGTFFPMRHHDDGDISLPSGTRGAVYVYKPSYSPQASAQFFVDLTDVRDSSGQVHALIGRRVAMFESLRYGSGAQHRWGDWEPLVDNWAPLQPTKRYHVPKPRKTTSRRGPRPNTSKRRTGRKKSRMRR
jgi:hypothetical protein